MWNTHCAPTQFLHETNIHDIIQLFSFFLLSFQFLIRIVGLSGEIYRRGSCKWGAEGTLGGSLRTQARHEHYKANELKVKSIYKEYKDILTPHVTFIIWALFWAISFRHFICCVQWNEGKLQTEDYTKNRVEYELII